MRFEQKMENGMRPAPVAFIAALNVLFLSVFLFFFQAQFGTAGYGIETVLSAQAGSGQVVEIVVEGGEHVRVNGSVITFDELKNFLAQLRSPSRSFLIVSGKQAAFDQVARVCELCRLSGALKVYVVTQSSRSVP